MSESPIRTHSNMIFFWLQSLPSCVETNWNVGGALVKLAFSRAIIKLSITCIAPTVMPRFSVASATFTNPCESDAML